jgi:hypothetical protein
MNMIQPLEWVQLEYGPSALWNSGQVRSEGGSLTYSESPSQLASDMMNEGVRILDFWSCKL